MGCPSSVDTPMGCKWTTLEVWCHQTELLSINQQCVSYNFHAIVICCLQVHHLANADLPIAVQIHDQHGLVA